MAKTEETEVKTTDAGAPEVVSEKKKSVDSAKGTKITVVGEAIHSKDGSAQYRTTVVIPRTENYSLYLREAILMKLRQEDLLYVGVVTWNVDKIEKTDAPITFVGKNIFDLSRDECFAAKAYYGLGGFTCYDGDLRTVQKEIYRRFAKWFGIDNGTVTECLEWEPIVLKAYKAPKGDTVLPAELPVAFDDAGDVFIKTFRKIEQ